MKRKPPIIASKLEATARLTIGTLNGRFVLLCDTCKGRRAAAKARRAP